MIRIKTLMVILFFILLTSVHVAQSSRVDTMQSTVLAGHANEVVRVAFSPDSRLIVSSSADGSNRLWDLGSRRELRRYPHKCENLIADFSLTFSPDGRFILSGCDDGVRVWDVNSGREVRYFGSRKAGSFETFSSDARFVIERESGGSHFGGGNCIWNVETEREVVCLANTRYVSSSALSSDGRWVVTGDSHAANRSINGLVRLWDARNGRVIARLVGKKVGVASVTFSPNGQRIAAGYSDGSSQIWEVQSGRQVRRLVGPRSTAYVIKIAFSPDGQRLLASFSDKSLQLWDIDSGRLVENFRGHTEQILTMAISPDGRLAASGSLDKSIRLWILPE